MKAEYTESELSERRIFIIEQVRKITKEGNIVYYSGLADKLEYAGISRQETYDTIHMLEKKGFLVRIRKKGRR
jgi:hypothetical protein